MIFRRRRLTLSLIGIAVLAVGFIVAWRLWRTALERRAEHHNNLGIALLENGYVFPEYFEQSVVEFEAALEAMPASMNARYNLGLARFYTGDLDEALVQMQTVFGTEADSARAHFSLGLIQRSRGELQTALEHFEAVARVDPKNPSARYYLGSCLVELNQPQRVVDLLSDVSRGPLVFSGEHYWLGMSLARLGRSAESQAALREFKARLRELPTSPLLRDKKDFEFFDLDAYFRPRIESRMKRPLGRGQPEWTDETSERRLLFRHLGSRADDDIQAVLEGEPRPRAWFADEENLRRLRSAMSAGIAVLDFDSDERLDVFLVNVDGKHALLKQDNSGRFVDVTARVGLRTLPLEGMSCASGDFNNDGWPDLVVTGYGDLRLYQNTGGAFEDVTEASGIADAVDPSTWCLGVSFADHDFEGDLDLYVACLVDLTKPGDGAELRFPDDFAGQENLLFRNNRDGTFREIARDAGLDGGGSASLVPFFTHLDDDGAVDLVLFEADGSARGFRNQRDRTFAPYAEADLSIFDAPVAGEAIAYGDLDRDGWPDRVQVRNGGSAQLLHHGGFSSNWLVVRLKGNAEAGNHLSNRRGIGGTVEVRAVGLWRRDQLPAGNGYFGCNAPEIYFNLGDTDTLDFAQGWFPSGLRWSLTNVDANQTIIIPEPVIPGGSCPTLFTWDGERFSFLTDTISAGILGEPTGPGEYWQPDPDEWLRIPGDRLVAKVDGEGKTFDLRFVNPLEEVTYLDRVRLLAIDHPLGTEIYPNETMVERPEHRRDHRLFAVRTPRAVLRATTATGRDRTAAVVKIDRDEVGPESLLPFKGFAREWSVTLDLGEASGEARDILLLDSWTHWNSPASAIAASQCGRTLWGPVLEVCGKDGRWRVANDDMGVSAGLTRTIVVDLRGVLQPGERLVRIRTNKMVYYDRIRIAEIVDDWAAGSLPSRFAIRSRERKLLGGELRWLGYPKRSLPDGKLPTVHDYQAIEPLANWSTHIGKLTRYGDVTPLLDAVDDRFVVMSHGEEVALRFDAKDIRAPEPGSTRTFIFFGHGYEKGYDLHSAHHRTVGPLPFAGMTSYPYDEAREGYPTSDEHLEYLFEWNTRPSFRSAGR